MNALKVASDYLKMAYDFSSLQLQIPEEDAVEIYKWGLRNIPDSILAADGREDDIHVTIKYGIHNHDFTEGRNFFIGQKPIEIGLGEISLFENDEHDVVKIDIDSLDLMKLNKLISENMEITDTHKIYKPHLTLAYVLKGYGSPYNGRKDFLNKQIVSDTVCFSGKDNNKTYFKLI